jgi:5'-deoxynucleotidase
MAELSLRQKLRTGHVKRWQIVRVAREQTIAEHMYLVAQIAEHLSRELGAEPDVRVRCIRWAMMHDIPEVVTGDLATPVKAAMREAVPHSDPIRRIELSLSDEYSRFYLSLKDDYPLVIRIVKLADTLEAVNFLVHEGMGKHAEDVLDGLRERVVLLAGECIDIYPQYAWWPVINGIMAEINDA